MKTKTTLPAALLAIGLLAACSDAPAPATGQAAQSADPAATAAQGVLAQAVPTPQIEAATEAIAALGPHTQATYPPVPFPAYTPPRPAEVVTAAYQFAAEHPEVLSYVPCFCGCQNGGHKGNHDCFVRSRAANGDVIEWEPHGVECAVCIDVATRSRQLYSSGASVADIRAAIEREFVPLAQTMTPTPKPPAAHSH
jgi:hypothetical protein